MIVWVITFEEVHNYSILVGVYDSQEKARAAAAQYLKDWNLADVCTRYDEDEISECWSDEYSYDAVVIERTRVV